MNRPFRYFLSKHCLHTWRNSFNSIKDYQGPSYYVSRQCNEISSSVGVARAGEIDENGFQ
jgi:hypothetical protein